MAPEQGHPVVACLRTLHCATCWHALQHAGAVRALLLHVLYELLALVKRLALTHTALACPQVDCHTAAMQPREVWGREAWNRRLPVCACDAQAGAASAPI